MTKELILKYCTGDLASRVSQNPSDYSLDEFKQLFIFKAGSQKWVSRNPNFQPDFCGSEEQLQELYSSLTGIS